MTRFILPIFVVMYIVASAQQVDIKEKIDLDARQIQESYDIPGLAVGMLIGDFYYAQGFGSKNTKSVSAVTPTSVYHMASVSKPVVATAIVKLWENGIIKLEDKLIRYLPYFTMKDERFKEITIQQILNHTSGIPDVEDYEWENPQYDAGAAERYSKSFTQDSLDFEPGSNFRYSNAAYNLLADVIAKITGQSFEDYMKTTFFKPIGMQHSSFYKPDIPDSIATEPHGMNAELMMHPMEVYPYNRIHAPSSTLNSNVHDMLQWARLYLGRGTFEGHELFSKKTYTALTTETRSLSDTRGICLGWFVANIDGETIYYHSGGDEGYRTFFAFVPKYDASLVIMGNNDYFQSSRAALYLINKFILKKPAVWKKPIRFALKDIILTEGIDSCKSFYINAKNNKEDVYDLSPNNLDALGYWLMDGTKLNEALDIFLFNVELFPEESGFYDSVGDAYVEMDNIPKAIEWYERALELNPDQDFTIQKLERIKKN